MESRAPYPEIKASAKSYQAHEPKSKTTPQKENTRQATENSRTESESESEGSATPEPTRLLDRVLVLARRRAGDTSEEANPEVDAERKRHRREENVPAVDCLLEEAAHQQDLEKARLLRVQASEDRKYAAKLASGRLSRAEVDKEVWALVDAEGGLGRSRGEGQRAWIARMRRLDRRVRKLWTDNQERLEGAEKRYVDGMPVREMIRPPVFRPHMRRLRSGLGECLPCGVKRLPCSRTRVLPGVSTREPCRRCARSGEPCLAPPDEDKPTGDEDGTEPLSSAGKKSAARQERGRVDKEVLDAMAGVMLDVGGAGRLVKAQTARFALPLLRDEDGVVQPATCDCVQVCRCSVFERSESAA